MANVSDKLAAMACPLGIVYVFLVIAAAQNPSPPPVPTTMPPTGSTPAPVLFQKGVAVSLFPYPYPGHVELFPGIDPKDMTGSTTSIQHRFPLENVLITALVPDPAANAFYYIDVYTNSIYRWDNVKTTLNDKDVTTITQISKVFEGLSRAICKLDYDYLSGNIYWSDPLLHWIAMIPADSNSTRDMKILLTDDVDYVAAMALDVESKYLFWVSSAYEDAKMERSNLYGGERKVILNTSFGFVDDMALDMTEKKLYWVDSYRMTVETVGYDGSGRRIIRRLVGTEFTSIAVVQSTICLVNFDDYEMQCMYKTSGDRYAYHNFGPSNPYAVGFFNPAVQKTDLENKCATTACDHICVNTNSMAKCLCSDGYTLASNGKACTQKNPLYDNGVVMTNSTHICMVSIYSLLSTASDKPLRCEATNATKDTNHIQSHVAKNLLYYTAKGNDPASSNKTQLLQFDLSTRRHWVVVTDMEEADDMAFDWVGEKMYTCHSKLNQIKAWDVVTGRSSIIYSGNSVTKVSALAIDPHRANLVWIADTSNGLGIFLGTFAGDTPVSLVGKAELTKPSGITYDYLDDKIFYIDSGRYYIVDINGSIESTRVSNGDATLSLVYKNYAVWNSKPASLTATLYSLDASTYNTDTTMGTIQSMTLFAKEAQKAFLDPCKINNGGCDDLCFRNKTTVTCACDFGRTMKPDGKSCTSVPLTTNFTLVTDLSHDRIVQVSMDGNTLISLPINILMTPAMARYGHHDSKLYWSEIGSKSIKRGPLDGTKMEKLVNIGGDMYPDRFAIDFTTNHLYYAVAHTKEFEKSYIAVTVPKVDKIESKILIKDLHFVGGLVLHPGKGYIYYNNHGREVYIGRTDSDGGNAKKIVTFPNNEGVPLGMTIDYQSGLLYWADAYTDQDKIEYIDLDGTTSTRGVLRRDMTADIVDLVISNGYLYYVGYNRHRIVKVHIATKKLVDFMDDQPEFGACDSTDIVPTTNTQPVNTQCALGNGMCSHYCFSRPTGKKCGCPDGMYLNQSTLNTCTTVPPKCPIQIPNGKLNPGCTALSGTSCGYSCLGDNYIKNPMVSIINCTSTLFWDVSTDSLCIAKPSTTQQPPTITTTYTPPATVHDTTTHVITTVHNVLTTTSPKVTSTWTPTTSVTTSTTASTTTSTIASTTTGPDTHPEEKVCPTNMEIGSLVSCQGKAGETCGWTCPAPLVKKPLIDSVTCLDTGRWGTDLDDLCVAKAKCDSQIPNGNLLECTYDADASCTVTCNTNYTADVDYIHCLPDGIWDKNVQTLCRMITETKCPSVIPKGTLQACDFLAGKSCKITCNPGYSADSDFIHCLPDGMWDKELSSICEITKMVTPEKQTGTAQTAGLTAAVAVVVTLLIIVLALGVTFYFCRRRVFSADKQNVQGRYRASPNVYFNASDDSRGQTPAPGGGFTNPALQAASNGEAMPNTNPLKMDQINLSDETTKDNLHNEGHYDSIKDGRPAAGAAVHEAVNPLYAMQPHEEMAYKNAEDVPEKPGYHRFS